MDDFFAVASLLTLGLWLVAWGAFQLSKQPVVRKYATMVFSWRGYFLALWVISVFRIAFFEMFWIPSSSMQPTLREREFVVVDKYAYGIKMPLSEVRLTEGRQPERGEIVVFRYPPQDNIFYIKRIIGLPGDKLTIDGNRIELANQTLTYAGPANEDYVYTESATEGLMGGVVDLVTGKDPKEVASHILWEQLPEGWHPMLLTNLDRSPVLPLTNDYCSSNSTGGRLECVIPDNSYFVMGDNRHRSNDSRFWGIVPAPLMVGPAFAVAISLDSLGRSFSSLGLSAQASEIDGFEPPSSLQ